MILLPDPDRVAAVSPDVGGTLFVLKHGAQSVPNRASLRGVVSVSPEVGGIVFAHPYRVHDVVVSRTSQVFALPLMTREGMTLLTFDSPGQAEALSEFALSGDPAEQLWALVADGVAEVRRTRDQVYRDPEGRVVDFVALPSRPALRARYDEASDEVTVWRSCDDGLAQEVRAYALDELRATVAESSLRMDVAGGVTFHVRRALGRPAAEVRFEVVGGTHAPVSVVMDGGEPVVQVLPLLPPIVGGVPVINSPLSASFVWDQPFTYTITASGAPTSFDAVGAPSAAPPVITSALTANGTAEQAFSYQIVALNAPTSFGAVIPPELGLSVNPATGLISGTIPAGVTGSFNVTIQATNAAGTTPATLVLGIAAAAVAYRYWRVTITDIGTPWLYSGLVLNEIQGYAAADGSGPNVFLASAGATCASTGGYPGGGPEALLIDGDTTDSASVYAAIGAAVNGYFQIDLPVAQVIRLVKLYYCSGTYRSGVTLRASNDGVNWVNVSTQVFVASAGRPTLLAAT